MTPATVAALELLVEELPEAWLGGELRAAIDSGQAERCACAADLLTEAVNAVLASPLDIIEYPEWADEIREDFGTVIAELRRIQGGAR